MKDYVIDVCGLDCKNGQQYLLKDINWQVKKGEHWVIFGLNGSGKTTLLKVIAGFKKPSKGMVKVFGENYHADNLLAFRRKIGLVSASCFDEYYHMESALEVVLSGLVGALGLDFDLTDNDVKKAKALLFSLNLGEKINQSYRLMSKGEREKVLIARAILAKPEILLLDEPCSGLDVTAREVMLRTIEALAKANVMTIIYVTHYFEEILACFQKGLLLKNGRIFQQGNVEAIFSSAVMSDFLETTATLTQEENGRLCLTLKEVETLDLLKAGEWK